VATLVSNRYGKTLVRVLKVDKNPGKHIVHDYSVQVLLEGDFDTVYTTGDNTKVVPTDTVKNTCYYVADRTKFSCPEEYAIALGKHFLQTYSWVDRVNVDIVNFLWDRMTFDGKPHEHSFSKSSPEVRFSSVISDRKGGIKIESGIKDLIVMKTTASGFVGYNKDKYTTLQETTDRIFATSVYCKWKFSTKVNASTDFNKAWETARSVICSIFANTYSKSVQETQMLTATEIIRRVPEIEEVSSSMPNKHSLTFNLEPLGLKNTNTIFQSIEEPSGLIESVVRRNNAKL